MLTDCMANKKKFLTIPRTLVRRPPILSVLRYMFYATLFLNIILDVTIDMYISLTCSNGQLHVLVPYINIEVCCIDQ